MICTPRLGMLVVTVSLLSCGSLRAQKVPATRAPVADLPLTWVPPTGTAKGVPAHVTAVLLTGDGGWAELIRSVANGLAAQGIAVVGFNSRSWLSSNKTPESTAAAIVRVLEAATQEWPTEHIVLVGYSRGADFAPFVANRLPPTLASKLSGIAMFGLAPMASFEFHWTDLVKDTRRASDIPIIPELAKLRGTAMVCVYGADEETSGCRDAPAGLLVKDERGGGHHFDGNCDALVQHVLDLLLPRGTPAHAEPARGTLCVERH